MGLWKGARRAKFFQAQTPARPRRKIWVKFDPLFSIEQVTSRKGERRAGSNPAPMGGSVGCVPVVGFHLSCLHLHPSVPGGRCIRGSNIIWGNPSSPILLIANTEMVCGFS